MAFAQLTYRESLRDIEACLESMSGKLYHMGFRSRIARSTLADANEAHDWRIFADFAQHPIATARLLYAGDPVIRWVSTWMQAHEPAFWDCLPRRLRVRCRHKRSLALSL